MDYVWLHGEPNITRVLIELPIMYPLEPITTVETQMQPTEPYLTLETQTQSMELF